MTRYYTAGYARRVARKNRRRRAKNVTLNLLGIALFVTGPPVGLWIGLFCVDQFMPNHPLFKAEWIESIAIWR